MATIVIDPGHTGGYNPGICYGYYEGNAMLTLAKYLGDKLMSMGADVRYTRTTNTENPSLTERGGMAVNADLFISLHSDASDNAQARGVTSYFSVRLPNTEPFATAIGTAAANAMGNQFRGSLSMYSATFPTQDYFGVLRAAVAVGAKNAFLIEHGFHTNETDCLLLSDDAVLRRIADAEAIVIAQHLGLAAGCLLSYTVQPGDSLYKVARKFNITWESIAAVNSITSPYIIRPGQHLTIPLSTDANCQFVYNVETGDSLYSIAQKFGVVWEAIASANGIYHPFIIMPGQRLVIPLPRL